MPVENAQFLNRDRFAKKLSNAIRTSCVLIIIPLITHSPANQLFPLDNYAQLILTPDANWAQNVWKLEESQKLVALTIFLLRDSLYSVSLIQGCQVIRIRSKLVESKGLKGFQRIYKEHLI